MTWLSSDFYLAGGMSWLAEFCGWWNSVVGEILWLLVTLRGRRIWLKNYLAGGLSGWLNYKASGIMEVLISLAGWINLQGNGWRTGGVSAWQKYRMTFFYTSVSPKSASYFAWLLIGVHDKPLQPGLPAGAVGGVVPLLSHLRYCRPKGSCKNPPCYKVTVSQDVLLTFFKL
jgi:hypothetical protein